MTTQHYIACDLGAESGRVILGTVADGKLSLKEMHRFPTGAFPIQGSLRWNVLRIFEELKSGLKKVAAEGVEAASVSTDSWGVDYVFFNERQPMLSLPYHYRDTRTESTYDAALAKVGEEKIFAETGIQFMAINTLYHMIADVEQNPDVLAIADQFLNIADYMNYLFSGVAKNEVSNCSTTQMFNTAKREWSQDLITAFDLPAELFPEVVDSGTVLGPLTEELQAETGLGAVDVIAGCSHDTGDAVAAVPAEGDDWAYLSSGTWSLIGVELPAPLINEDVRACNFTNEAGFGGTTRFLKNIVGLWLQQESRRTWVDAGMEISYPDMDRLAEEAEPLRSIINPNDPRFVSPGDMPTRIAEYCRETGQPVPETQGQVCRCIMESLSLLYRHTLADIERLTGRTVNRLHVVGGGSKSALLNQLISDSIGRPVLAGPVESTAIGNLLIQGVTLGHIESHAALRDIVRTSIAIETFEPNQTPAWQAAHEKFAALAALCQ